MAATLLQERKKILQEQKNAAIKLNESLQRLPNFGAASNSFTKLNDAEQLQVVGKLRQQLLRQSPSKIDGGTIS